MKKIIAFFVIGLLAGCGTKSLPVAHTGVEGEYVVVASHYMSFGSSIEIAQQEAIDKAKEACGKMGKSYEKKYSIDRPLGIGQVPESTLFFKCVDKI